MVNWLQLQIRVKELRELPDNLLYSIAEIIFLFVFIYPVTLCIIWLVGGLYFVFQNERRRKYRKSLHKFLPFVTILVPCHNEENIIRTTCENLLSLDYVNYRVLFINDASTDHTADIIREYIENVPFFHLLSLQVNCGKAKALNTALELVNSPLVLVLDADTVLDKKALRHLAMPFILKRRIGAVTANVFPKNCSDFWEKLQSADFASIVGLIKRSQSIWGSIYTVSGCSTIYNTEVLRQVGGFSSYTATEDIDISWRIQRTSHRVLFEPKAVAYISVPKSLRQYIKQRKRWVLGGWHLLRQHKGIFTKTSLYRLWVVYIELVISLLWAFCFIGTILFLVINFILHPQTVNSIIPGWNGAFASFLFMVQTLLGIMIGSRYNKSLIKSISAACWYPLAFFIINPTLAVVTSFKGLFGNSEKSSKWSSPKRIDENSQ
jgi:poly-beta-1,6-N-acetyl-D-glucosamine synthase